MLTAAAIRGLLLAALLVPADGRTAWLDGAFEGRAWERAVTAEPGGWLLVELAGRDPEVDLDVSLADGEAGWRRTAAGHSAREWLLARAAPGAQLRVRVRGPAGRATPFVLGLTRLSPLELAPDGQATLRPAEGRRAVLLQLDGRPDDLGALEVLGGRGGPLEVGAFDLAGRPLAAATGPGSLTLPPAPGAVVLAVGPGAGPVHVSASLAPRPPETTSPLDGFLLRLGRTPAQREVLTALRTNHDFARLRTYLEEYPGGLPVRLQVVPGLRAQGVERFGTYANRVLAINPTMAGHRSNVQELVDTLVHELIHAVLSLPRARGFPFEPWVLDSAHDPRLAALGSTPLRRGRVPAELQAYLDAEYGPSASNPAEDYCDVNAGAQRLIVKVVEDTLRRTRIGRETLVFENVRARERQLRLGGSAAKK